MAWLPLGELSGAPLKHAHAHGAEPKEVRASSLAFRDGHAFVLGRIVRPADRGLGRLR